MTLLFLIILMFGIAGLFGVHYLTRLNRLNAIAASHDGECLPPANRYKPMLRLLSESDESLLARDADLLRRFRKQRMEIFRGYLATLTADYGKMLGAIRTSMVASGVDRPDLAAALLKNRTYFALAICRIEYRLLLTQFGIGSVDVSGLVEAVTALQSQLQVFTPVAMGATAR